MKGTSTCMTREGRRFIKALDSLNELTRGVETLEQLGFTDPTEKADMRKQMAKLGNELLEYAALLSSGSPDAAKPSPGSGAAT